MTSVIVACISSLALGILASGMFTVNVFLPIIAAACCLAVAAWCIRYSSKQVLWFLAVACFFVGIVRGLQADVLPTNDISHFIGRTVSVYGYVDATPEAEWLSDGIVSVRYRIRVESVKINDGTETASGGLFATVRQSAQTPIYPYGVKIALGGTVKALHGYNNPGMPDMVASWRRQGYTVRLTPSTDVRFLGQARDNWGGTAVSLREAMLAKMKTVMSESDAAVLKGVLFGGYAGIPKNIVREFASTGIIHILSVSGSHIALVAGAVHWLGGAAGLTARSAAAFSSIAVMFYALLAGMSPPVIRSVAMGLITLFAAVWGREKDAVNSLLLTGAAMLAYQPSLIEDISFQLSFGGTAGLVFFYTKLTKLLYFVPAFLQRPVAATAAAQLGVLPILAWYFSSIPLISFVANLLVVPLIELTVVFGLTGEALSLIIPAVGQLLLTACSLLMSAAMHINSLLAMSPLAIYLPPMGLLASAAYYVIAAWFFGLLHGAPAPASLMSRQPRRTLAVALITVIIAVGAAWWPRQASVHFIDVGQGDATLVLTPRGQAVLIDTGGTLNADFDIGERVVLPYLRRLHVTKLDCLILTHSHQDHAGGAAFIAANLPVSQILMPPEEYTPAVKEIFRRNTTAVLIPAYSGQLLTFDGVQFVVRRADMPVLTGKSATINENSAVIEVRYGVHSFLITGDLEGLSEKTILSQGISKQSVLKVGHHGAKSSSSPAFIETVDPEYAVISVGAGNRYGHPHPETVARLSAEGRKLFRTDQHGAIVFKTDGVRLRAETFMKPSGG